VIRAVEKMYLTLASGFHSWSSVYRVSK